MDFRDTPEQAAWRGEVRQFLALGLHRGIRTERFQRAPDTDEFRSYRAALAKRGWVAPAWPREYGGAGLTPMAQFILNQEFAEASAPTIGGMGVAMLGPTLITYGTDEQKKEHLSRILRGEVMWAQGYSEPGAGSDLASLQTRAHRDGDDFVINGQKIWSSGAHAADWMFVLTRTDPDAPKHRGITYLLLDLKTPGVTVRPLTNLANRHEFNEVFFEDVRVPARNVVGEVNRGWYVGATTLDFERSSIGGAVEQRRQLERAAKWLKAHRGEVTASDYGAIRKRWCERAVEVGIATQLSYRIISMQSRGEIPNVEASMAKLFVSELAQRVAQTVARTIGMWGGTVDPSAPWAGEAGVDYLATLSITIAGGTSEIQRNVIATRGLGLPRG